MRPWSLWEAVFVTYAIGNRCLPPAIAEDGLKMPDKPVVVAGFNQQKIAERVQPPFSPVHATSEYAYAVWRGATPNRDQLLSALIEIRQGWFTPKPSNPDMRRSKL